MMKNSSDWQDALGALLGSVPAAEEETTPQPQPAKKSVSADRLTFAMERKGRAGKTATIISGFTASQDELERIAAKLKSALGTGGSARGGEILIQGNRREDARRILKSMGYNA